MSTSLQNGLNGTLWIEINGAIVHQTKITDENKQEAVTFIETYGHKIPSGSWFQSIVMPLRTDSFDNFCRDFFLPTLVNRIHKIGKLPNWSLPLALIGALVIDVLFISIRAITSPFRALYNWKNPISSHPLHTLLENIDAAKHTLDYGKSLTIHFKATKIEGIKDVKSLKMGDSYLKTIYEGSKQVGIKMAPELESYQTATLKSYRYEWKKKNYKNENEWVYESGNRSNFNHQDFSRLSSLVKSI